MNGDRGKPLGIVAGGGSVPLHVANAAAGAGRSVFILGIGDEADDRITAYPHAFLQWGQIGRMQKIFNEHGIEDLVLVGNIRVRPDYRKLKLDMGAVRVVPKVISLLANGDSNLLSGVITLLGDLGFKVVGAHEIAPDLVVAEGLMGRNSPDKAARRDIDRAMQAARAIGLIDAGQAAVAVNGRVVALEAAEGTDAMLKRVAALREEGRLRWSGQSGVLAKCAKPQQDLRVDMPTIGPKTVRAAIDIGLAGIAVEADRVMVVDRQTVAAEAETNGIFVIGDQLRGELAT